METVQPPAAGEPLPIPAVRFSDDTRDAARMIADINRQRIGAGDPPLRVDPALQRFARGFAFDRLFFRRIGHLDRRGRPLAARLFAAHVRFRFAGENLAFTREGENDAMLHLIASPHHLENLLDAHYTRMGIAAVSASVYGTMYVQEFAGD